MSKEVNPLVSVERVFLRDRRLTDVDRFVHWQTHGEWCHLDAPWEGFGDALTSEQEEKSRTNFLKNCRSEQPVPRRSAFIIFKNNDCQSIPERKFPRCHLCGHQHLRR